MSFSLPIDAVKKEFLQQLSSHHLVVEAETGSGKSTRLPIWAAKYGKVLVVEPRRVACTSLAEFIAVTPDDENRIWGCKIGYAIRFDNQFDQGTDIVFVTPGVALRWLSENGLTDFKTIIIDEFHERRWDTDLLLSLLLQTQSHRLVVTSATLDSQRLAEYMAAQRLTANGRMFDVEVIHQASDARSMPEIQHIERKIGQALEVHREHHQDILVFLPGRKEISSVKQSLQQKYRDDIEDGKLDVISLHASVSEQEKQRALTESEKQRIILATNVAETSLTIPGITLIIDSGLEQRTHQRNGRTVLSLHAISNASAEQRKGRAGRVRSGTCIRLYGKAAPLERLTPPELLREELVEPYLAALCCGYSLESLPFIDVLPEKTLEQARSVLTKMKAIDDKGAITDHGRVLYPLPIDTLFAHLITAMPTRGLKEAMVDLSAALSVPQKLWQSPCGEEQLALLKQWLKIEGCDATALIAIVRTPFDELPDWLNVNPLVHQEAQQLSVQIRDALELPELTVASLFKRAEWLDAVMVATPELVFVRREDAAKL
ncbi:helicase-related protein [Photobacterium damselae subsp. piscicida]|nr:helicase-related protein [Photobacterium damselae subsp. piscicida]